MRTWKNIGLCRNRNFKVLDRTEVFRYGLRLEPLRTWKNIGLCRNFQLLDLTEVFRYGLCLKPLRTRETNIDL